MKTTRIIIGVLASIAIVILLAIYLSTQVKIIRLLENERNEAYELSNIALGFNVETYNTLYEVMSYVYNPIQENLNNFEKHKTILKTKLADFGELVRKADADAATEEEEIGFGEMFDGAYREYEAIAYNIQIAEESAIELINGIEKYKKIEESGEDSIEELAALEQTIMEKVSETGDLLDNIGFNRKVDEFVARQSLHAKKIDNALHEKLNAFSNTILMILGSVVVAIIGFGTWAYWGE